MRDSCRESRFYGAEETPSASGPVNRIASALTATDTSTAVVRIMPDPSDPKEYVATKCTFARRGDGVRFENLTKGTVDVQFPLHDLFDQDSLTLGAGDVSSLIVGPYARAGEYPFAAYCQKGGRFARGGSMPIIIVEPKG
jgi:hypothetical protein